MVGMNRTVKKVTIAQTEEKVTSPAATAFVATSASAAAKNHIVAAMRKFNFDRRDHSHAAPMRQSQMSVRVPHRVQYSPDDDFAQFFATDDLKSVVVRVYFL